jgi:hypothetical protein
MAPSPFSVETGQSIQMSFQTQWDTGEEYDLSDSATPADFTYWRSTKQAIRFREAFSPEILVADRTAAVKELKRASLVMRAQSYRRRLFFEFDRAKQVFLP